MRHHHRSHQLHITRFAIIIITAGALSLLGSCYSSDYHRGVVASARLLRDLASKLEDYCRADFNLGGRQVSSEEMGEFYYALKKARSFAEIERDRSSRRASYREFMVLLDDYQNFVAAADQYRLDSHHRHDDLQKVLQHANEVRQQAERVLASANAERT